MYKEITKDWTPTVDLFAHTNNAKCHKFYAYGNAPHNGGVDAFAQAWDNEIAWACPPVYLITDVIKKIEASRMLAILCVPAWRSASFWPVLFPDGEYAIESCKRIILKRPWIIRGRYCTNKVMQGRTAFPFLFIYLKSRGAGHTGRCGSIKCPAI